ncbi:ThuA domain-containing protein [Pararhodonellum marinum]|uniref:ThuA domain-containing protein n=1 Tax=Pararhodonellum marinum TaxID=2755358 RepID=UPI00189007E9|nr:ThuA domain-containing protein [Pararhodonellum marinum]
MNTSAFISSEKKILLLSVLFFYSFSLRAQSLPEVKLDNSWIEKIHALAPESPSFPVTKKKNILVFSLHTGFEHWVIPHTEEMLRIISEKSGAFEVTGSKDISMFEARNLKNFDAVILNNTCSKPDHRNLFWDKLSAELDADSTQLIRKALAMESNLIKYVEKGGGLMVVHGGVTTLNQSKAFSRLVGASFDYHPPQQPIQVRLVDASHPLVQSFPKEGFNHVDEPYFYSNAYADLDFRPLLYFNNSEITDQRKNQIKSEGKTYVAWIRSQGKGKVMYCSPSHNAQSFENQDLLRFFLNGLQYVVGDVDCDDNPLNL